jgi:hypothetical protein
VYLCVQREEKRAPLQTSPPHYNGFRSRSGCSGKAGLAYYVLVSSGQVSSLLCFLLIKNDSSYPQEVQIICCTAAGHCAVLLIAKVA